MRWSERRDVIGGALLFLVGAAYMLAASRLPPGTARQMGPGYFPVALSGILMVLGAFVVIFGLRRSERLEIASLRPLFFVLLAVAVFASSIRTLGFLPAVMLAGGVSSLGDRTVRLWPTLMLLAGLAGMTWLVFIQGLHLTIPVARWPF